VAALAVFAVAEDSGVTGAAPVPEHAIDELDQFDADVFSADPVTHAMPAPPAASSESAESAESSLDEEDGAHDSESAYSFRAMQAATDVAGSGLISEKAAETHRMAQKFLQDTKASADDMFAEINREQQILMAKRALVARQKESITDSQRSLKRLSALIKDNKGILKKNEAALRGASDDLLKLISTYQSKLKDGLNSEIGAAKPKKAKKAAAPKKVAKKKQPKKAKKAAPVKKTNAKTTKPAAKVAKKAAKAASAKKVKFMQIDDTDTDTDTATETDSDESDSETDSDAEDSDEEESEESEEEEDTDTDSESENESDSEDEELSEESLLEVRAGLLDEDNIDLLGIDRTAAPVHDDIDLEDTHEEVDMHAGNLLPGLGAPPKLYKPEEDEF